MHQSWPRHTIQLAAFLSILLGACSDDDEATVRAASRTTGPNAPILEGRLDILARSGQVERGSSDEAFDWVTPFEKATACKVSVTVASGPDELVMAANRKRHDIVIAGGDIALHLIAAGKVQPIAASRVPALAQVDRRLQNRAWFTVDRVSYGVPFQWGPTVLVYDAEVFKDPPGSWSLMFVEQTLPDGTSNAGRVQAYAAPIAIADAAVLLMSTRPELRIRDPYALDERQYAAAIQLVRAQRNLLQGLWSDPAAQLDDFRSKAIVAATSRAYQASALVDGGEPFASTVPVEGATGWADTSMLQSGAAHPNCAYAWLEWSLKPKVQGDIAAWNGSVPVVPTACRNNELLGVDGCVRNGALHFNRLHFWRTPQARCLQGKCVPYSRWTRDYQQITGR